MRSLAIAALALLGACGQAPDAADERVVMRNLATSAEGAPAAETRLSGTPIPTPSDPRARYAVLRERTTLTGTVIAILRQESAGRAAFIRAEMDCGRRLFHVVGVGDRMATVESDVAHDGPLRPMAGLPLREEIARFVCERAGKPLAAA